ncbi:hypothetical protein EW026_g2791 [Hermanssonia centrifuga]|uniref:TPR-like protein n=1 Tax=Hermanssonia centrifuga TaxID=98765 RepID=A0A4S4KRS9_9APHY|nr:hypothetical protein EW026_g2791 [Hermanssonia centrifuga]
MTPQPPPKLTSTFDYLAQTRGHQSLISTRFILQTKQPFDEADLDDKILLYRVGLSDTDQAKTCTLGNVFVDLALALHIRFLQAGIMEDLDEAVSLAREVLLAHPTDHPGHLAFTINLGIILSTRSHQTGRSPDIMEAVSLLWQAVNSMGDGSDDDPLLLHELAFALRNRLKWRAAMWDVQGVPAGGEDISDAVSLHRRALNHTTTPAHRILSLNYLALALRTQALTHEHNNNAQQSSLALIDEAVALLRESVTISCAAPFTLRELATSLDARFSQTHALGDLNEAISLHRLSLDHLDEKHPRLSAILTSLVAALHRRYAETQDRQDFIDAVSLHHRVRLLHPKRHAGSSYAFAVLGPVLCPKIRQNTPIPHLPDTQSRGPIVSALPELRVLAEAASASESDDEEDSGRAELDHKISVLRKRISLNKTGDRAATLTELAIAVQARFTMQQERDFLDWDDSGITEAISLYEKALKLRAPPHPERASSLGNLALAKYVLYMQTNDMPDTSSLLDQVISLLRSALDLRPPTHPERSSTLNHLAVALHTRHEHAGRLVDLNESILLHREALVCCSETTTNDRATSLIGLAVALQARSEQLRQASSMDEAINLLEEALALHEVGSSRDHGYASLKLALALQSRYQQNGRLPDLRRATEVYHVGLSNLQHDQSSNSHLIGLMLSGLATALRTLFGITHAITDLEMAIELHSKALELLPENHHDTILCLNRLADAQYTMAETTGRADDLNEAISLCTDALRQFGRDNSDSAIRCPTLEILGRAFLLRFLRADELGDDWKDLFGAGKAFQEIAACPSAPLSQRFSAARMCARISDARDDGHGLALRGYSATVDLLPLLAGVATDLETRSGY